MLGHAEEWFYKGVAGISMDIDRGQSQAIRIAPSPVGNLRFASATYRLPFPHDSQFMETGKIGGYF
jgi:hypothetical protein